MQSVQRWRGPWGWQGGDGPTRRGSRMRRPQAAVRRMASEGPGPSQQCAIQAGKWIAKLRTARPNIWIEIRWCPAHGGVAGNEKAGE